MALISRRDAGKLLIGGSAGLWAVSRNRLERALH